MPIVLLGPGQADIQDDFPGMYGLVTALWLLPPEQAIHQSRQFTRAGNPLFFPRLYCINVFFYGRPVKPNSRKNWPTLPLVPVRPHFHALKYPRFNQNTRNTTQNMYIEKRSSDSFSRRRLSCSFPLTHHRIRKLDFIHVSLELQLRCFRDMKLT